MTELQPGRREIAPAETSARPASLGEGFAYPRDAPVPAPRPAVVDVAAAAGDGGGLRLVRPERTAPAAAPTLLRSEAQLAAALQRAVALGRR